MVKATLSPGERPNVPASPMTCVVLDDEFPGAPRGSVVDVPSDAAPALVKEGIVRPATDQDRAIAAIKGA